MPTHHINKVLLDFAYSGSEKDTALQKTKQLFNEKIIRRLTETLDSYPSQLYLDKLEIDLGHTTLEDFEHDFVNALKKSFNVHVQPIQERKTKQEEITTLPVDQLLFFLVTGYWPWNMQQKDEKEIRTFIQVIFKTESQARQLFQKLEHKHSFAAERLINLITGNNSIQEFFFIAFENYHPALQHIFSIMPAGWKKQLKTTQSFYFRFFTELLGLPPVKDTIQVKLLADKLISAFANTAFLQISIKPEADKAFKEKNTIRYLKALFNFLETGHQPDASGIAGKEAIPVKNKKTKILKEPANSEKQKQQPVTGSSTTETAPETTSPMAAYFEAPEIDKIHITNAGLVLFHPYLQLVFRELKWLNDSSNFVSKKAQQKAVLFLQYLVNGKSRQPEHQLVLNKLLCGWPIHMPIQTACTFSKAEKNIAVELIESLKEHWTVLKNTSNSGLIESFINRAGLIQKKPDGFLLQIERKTIDILLDSLPFGINIIKLAWNEQIIYTEW